MKSSDREFIAESEDILEEAESYLLDIQDASEREADPNSINAVFRCMHTLKGMSGLYGFQGMSDISHALESLLDDIRLGRANMDVRTISFLFEYIDILKGFINELRKGNDIKGLNTTSEMAQIEEFRSSIVPTESDEINIGLIDESLLKVLSEYEEHRLKKNIQAGRGIYLVKAVFSLMDFDRQLKSLTADIKEIGELISTMPTSEGVPDGSIGFSILTASSKMPEELQDVLSVEVDELVSHKLSAPRLDIKDENPQEIPVSVIGASGAGSPTVRVDIGKLDTSLNTVGELNVTTNTLRTLWKELSEEFGHSPLMIELYRVLQSYERRIMELKDQLLQIRMVPVSQIYAKLGQVLRRAARPLNKDVRMEVFGEDTELDKSLAEEVLDPLIHIVRNALDHGIESPDERTSVGKRAQGAVRLKSFQRGNNVVIEVSDDGRGLYPKKIRAKAIDRGLISDDIDLTDEDLFELLFSPGFSTKDNVSEISGRGVGLDVVKEKIASLGGLVEIKSKKGSGTTFTLTLPITLAIVKALIVRINDDKFAIPLSSISETLVIEEGTIQEVENSKVVDLRGEVLPLKSVREILALSGTLPERPFAVVAGMGERKAGLLVDELIGQQEIIIKPIGDYFEGVSGIAGAAEISKHENILVLDVESIVGDVSKPSKSVRNV